MRPGRSVTQKWPENGSPATQNRIGFLARHKNRGKCFVPASMPAFPPTTNRLSHCRSVPSGEYAARRGWAIALQVKEIGSGASQRQLRETLLEAARRRE